MKFLTSLQILSRWHLKLVWPNDSMGAYKYLEDLDIAVISHECYSGSFLSTRVVFALILSFGTSLPIVHLS